MAAPQQASGLPQNLTQAQVKHLHERYKQMTMQKVPPNDPEFIKVTTVLKSLRQHMIMKQQQHQQLQRARSQQDGQNGQGASSTQPGNDGTIANNGQAPGQSGNGNPAVSQAAPGAAAAFRPSAGLDFSDEQREILRRQLHAFKQLSRNMSVGQDTLSYLFSKRAPKEPAQAEQSKSQDPTQSLEAITSEVKSETSVAQQIDKTDIPRTKTPFEYSDLVDPMTIELGKGKADGQQPIVINNGILYSRHSNRRSRPMVPALIPPGIDYERVQHEREAMIYNRMQNRLENLRELGADQAYWDFTKSDQPIPNTDISMKHRIQLLKLQLLGKQRLLRQTISLDVLHSDNLAQTANRSAYRKRKKIGMGASVIDALATEKLEREMRDTKEKKAKTKQREHLESIVAHAREIRETGLEKKQRHAKIGKLMVTCQQRIEIEEQRRIERTAKQRLQALKNDDEATYLKLLGQAKDSRISHLLQQTDGFLGQLAASVKQQQRNAVARERYGQDFPEESEESEVEEDEDGNPKIDYYEVAHRIKEEVKAQPGILVGGTLKEYQVKGLEWMISLYNNNLNGILADEMGLGKTIQTISLVTHLVEKKNQAGPFLVIVPLSTLTNWNLEFERWAPSLHKIVYKGTPPMRRGLQQMIRQGQFQVLLTTYEYIIKDRPVLSKIKWVHMIIDEGHRMKNTQSKLSSTLTSYYHTKYRLILTGTPLQNNLPELWALLNFVLPNIFKSVKSFDEWFNTPFANTGSQDKMELSEEEQLLIIRRLHKVLRPFLLRRLKKDVEKDLPDKQERVIKCKFSALQARLYKQLVTSNKLSVSDGKGGKTSMRGLSNMLMQLRKLCNHPFVFELVEDECNPHRETNDLIWRSAGKFELLDRIMPKFKASGHRVLLFFQMTQIMNIMEDFLRLRGMNYLRLDGATKSDERSDLLKKFNAPDSPYFCFLLSTRAGGLGLNLQTADTVIIYDSDWNPFQDLQAQDRAHRIGQKNEVRILRLISSNSVEEKILERARFKLNMDTKVIQAGKFDNKTTNEERETMLRALLDSAEAADALNEQEEMDDDDLNTAMARSDQELVLFAEMDQARARDPVYGTGKMPRLMGENEVPDLYLQEETAAAEVAEEFVGRGARERTRVRYDDGLTEEQWAMAVDADDDNVEAAVARKQARIEKRQTNKEKRARGGAIESSPSRQSSEEPPARKQRGRKSAGNKRKAEEIDDTPAKPPPAKRGRQSKIMDTLSPNRRQELQHILDTVYDYAIDIQEEVEEEDGTKMVKELVGPFMKLVPKNLYPDYYLLVKNPISMEQIGKIINKNSYQSVREFVTDVKLLADNARLYNEDGSWLYVDATNLENQIMAKLREVIATMPEWANWETSGPPEGPGTGVSGPGSAVAPSTGAGSGTATPKLKLKFGGANKEAARSTPHADADDDDDD